MGAKAARDVGGEPNHDGIVRRSVDITVRGVDKEARSVEVVCSTDSIDAHGDIVEQTFDLKRFKKNPVVLFNHNRFGDSWLGGTCEPEDLLPIGKAKGTKVEDGQLTATLIFGSKDYNPLSEQIFLGFCEDMVRAVSIGFRPGKITEEVVDGKTRFRLAKNELFEISVVPIGSNPDSVAKSLEFDHKHFRLRMAGDAPEAAERGATDEQKDTAMNEKELQAALDKKTADLALAQKALTDEQSRASRLENELTATKASLVELQKSAEANDKKIKALEQTEADTAVSALIGKKITPPNKERFVKMYREDREGFDDIVKNLPDLPVLDDVVPPEPNGGTKGRPNAGTSRAKSYVEGLKKKT